MPTLRSSLARSCALAGASLVFCGCGEPEPRFDDSASTSEDREEAPDPVAVRETMRLASVALAPDAAAADAAYRAAVEGPPAGWTGPVFQLSHAYPATTPAAPPGGYPWKAFDFRVQPAEYIAALLRYARDGLEAFGWDPTKAPQPKWFHSPWLATGAPSAKGRECFHGMTRERSVFADEIDPSLPHVRTQNYAVGFYNDVGGWTFGRVWAADPAKPDLTKARFAEGAMSIKLLFTSGAIPYLAGSLEWDTHAWDQAQNKRVPRKLRLLQVDVAVRDSRNNSLTGWVFGTFVYNGARTGATPLDKLVPVGLMWGNDPLSTPANARPIEQSWINPATGVFQHLGYDGRLNGPVDNPLSSCLSCHSTAQTPSASGMVPPDGSTPTEIKRWFRNIRAGRPFDTTGSPPPVSLDYSLQMSDAVRAAATWRAANPAPGALLEARPAEYEIRR